MSSAIERELRYIEKWLLLSILIGVVSGIGAAAFDYALRLSTLFFLGRLAGYLPPAPGAPGAGFRIPENRLLLLASPTLGGLISGFLVYRLAPETEGPGTNAVIEAFHYSDGFVRARVPLVKVLASALTIGSGGSGGKQGPAAQIGGGLGSLIAQLLRLGPRDRRVALAVGLGSAIGAVFRAPMGGAILAAEIPYLVDFEPEVIPPAFIAAFVAYLVVGRIMGWGSFFAPPPMGIPKRVLYDPVTLAFFALLGLVNGVAGIAFTKLYYWVSGFFKRAGIPPELKPAVGGLLTGCIGALFPYVLGTGYGWLQLIMSRGVGALPLHIVLLLPFLKMLATAFSAGSGGSGGVFAPALVIGGSLGALVSYAASAVVPNYDVPVAAYVVVGMMSFFGGVGKVPISTIIMVGEMTGEYALFTPSLVSTMISYVVTGKYTLYTSQLPARSESPAHAGLKVGLVRAVYARLKRYLGPKLSTIRARDIMHTPVTALRADMSVEEAAKLASTAVHRVYPVVDSKGRLVGVLRLEDLPLADEPRASGRVSDLPLYRAVVARLDDSLERVLELMIEHEADRVFVVDREERLRGVVTVKELVQRLLAVQTLYKGVGKETQGAGPADPDDEG